MPSVKVVVNFEDKPSYDVRIGNGAMDGLGEVLANVAPAATAAAIITDTNVAPLYLKQCRESLKAAGLRVIDITVPAGEETKSAQVLAEVWQALAAKKLDRDCVVVALGGGVVGDLAGFAAATYLRGVGFVQVPTTLLAMVDSSVGGKTAIDLPQGKNLAGAFYQPLYVCADTDTLATLNDREWACGLGELAKTSVIDSDDFFFWTCEHADALRGRDPEAVREAIARCVVFKADVVAEDEEERTGRRACLNYGHTLGHAIEKLAGYGTYSHGAAVAEGMRFAIRLGAALEGTPIELVQQQDELLDELGLPVLDFSAAPDQMIEAMKNDKKSRGGRISFVIPTDVGECVTRVVDEATLREHLAAWANSKE